MNRSARQRPHGEISIICSRPAYGNCRGCPQLGVQAARHRCLAPLACTMRPNQQGRPARSRHLGTSTSWPLSPGPVCWVKIRAIIHLQISHVTCLPASEIYSLPCRRDCQPGFRIIGSVLYLSHDEARICAHSLPPQSCNVNSVFLHVSVTC